MGAKTILIQDSLLSKTIFIVSIISRILDQTIAFKCNCYVWKIFFFWFSFAQLESNIVQFHWILPPTIDVIPKYVSNKLIYRRKIALSSTSQDIFHVPMLILYFVAFNTQYSAHWKENLIIYHEYWFFCFRFSGFLYKI